MNLKSKYYHLIDFQFGPLTITQCYHYGCGVFFFSHHASVLLHYSFDFNPLTHNEVYCDMIAL